VQERRDIVIVGAGLAGLAAARLLAGTDYVVLEATDRVGGRLKSEGRGEHWMNFGAHIFGGPDSHVGRLIDAYGLTALSAQGPVTGLAFKDKVLANGRPETYPFLLPLSVRDRASLIRTGLKIRRHAKEYLKVVKRQPGEDQWAPSRRGQLFMNDRSFSEFLGPLSADLDSIFRTISNRAGAQPEQVSAGHGVAAFAMTLSKEPVLSRTIVGGSSLLPEAMAADAGDRIERNTEVVDVAADADGVSIRYRVEGKERSVRARAAIVTAPAYVASRIISTLPAATRAALGEMRYGPSVLMAIRTNETGAMPWDDVYAVTVPGSSFNMFFNIAHVLRRRDRRIPGGSLMIYGTGEPGRLLMDKSDDEVETRFLADLYRLFPEAKGIVLETKIQRWPAAAPYTFPGRGKLQAPLEAKLSPVFLAGDYLGTGFTETSVLTASDAARSSLALL
jgi:oxygen-dependent protoporphyrinogen oxidase